MSISYGIEKRFEYESNNATKPFCYKMLKKNNKLGCAGMISMKSCCMLAVAVIIFGVASPSQAMPNFNRFLIHKRSEEPQSTLIAFPRVGRSVSDDEYNMLDDQNAGTRESNGIIESNSPPYLKFGEKSRIHTRSSKGSMMAFPRVGKRSPTNHIATLLSAQGRDYRQGQWSDDQGFKEAVRSNDLYLFLHSMLKEIAKGQHQHALNDIGEY